MDIQKNPANITKYQSNPKVQKVMEKISSKVGGAGMGGAGGMGGFPPGGPPPPPPTGGATAAEGGDAMGLD